MEIKGYTAPGYESVCEKFSEEAYLVGTGGAAFAATKDGELVVDLWAGMADRDKPWNRNTRVHIQSTSKAVTGMAAMILVDQGDLDLDALVSDYWPEYGCNGKENTTVRMLLSHAAGSTRLPGHTELLDLDGNGFDQYDEIASRLAAAEPDWEPGTAHGYHGYTYGNLVSEVVYRITGQRAGEFLRNGYFARHGLNIWLGTPLEEQRDLAQIKPWPNAPVPPAVLEVMSEMMKAFAGDGDQKPAIETPGTWEHDAGFRGLLGGPMDTFCLSIGKLWSEPAALAAEFGSANATADARSLARMYAPLANEGVIDGVQAFKPETIEAFSRPEPPGGIDRLGQIEFNWRCGSHHGNHALSPGVPPIYGPNPNSFGMSGGVGNWGFADRENRIACGFVRNHYSNDMALSAMLAESVYHAAGI